MGHLEVNVEVDHIRTDGLEEPHVMQVKIDGLDASRAWDRAQEVVDAFLRAEIEEQRAVNRQVQAAEGPWCGHNFSDPKTNTGYVCNLPPDHQGPHENFQSGRSWPQRTPQNPEQKRLYHQAMVNRIWCNVAMPTSPLGYCCNLWKHHAGDHEYDRRRDNQYQEDCA